MIEPSYRIIGEHNGQAVVQHKYDPLPTALKFHQSTAKFRWFVGGRGAGKTRAGCEEVAKQSLDVPNNLGVIVRATYDEISAMVLPTLFDEVLGYPGAKDSLITRHDQQKHEIHLANHSVIFYRTFDDLRKTKGANLGWAYMEEADELPEDLFNFLTMTLRRKVPWNCLWVCSNPDGHDWLWRKFVDDPSKNTALKERFAYWQVISDENTFIPNYEEFLRTFSESGFSQEFIQRYRYASFNTFSGQIYEIDPSCHYLDDSFNIPQNWNRVLGCDYGYRNPTAMLLSAVDYNGNIVFFDEIYRNELSIGALAQLAHSMLRKDNRSADDRRLTKLIDPSAAGSESSGFSIVDQFAEHGLWMDLADNAVLPGINRMQEYLLRTKNVVREYRQQMGMGPDEPLKVIPPAAKRCVFFKKSRVESCLSDICGYKWKQMSSVVSMRRDGAEQPEKKDDHGADVARYVINSMPESKEDRTDFIHPYSFEGVLRKRAAGQMRQARIREMMLQ